MKSQLCAQAGIRPVGAARMCTTRIGIEGVRTGRAGPRTCSRFTVLAVLRAIIDFLFFVRERKGVTMGKRGRKKKARRKSNANHGKRPNS